MAKNTDFDPLTTPEPESALTQLVRGLTIGQRVTLVDGTEIRSVRITRGAHQERRYAVVTKKQGANALQRHRALTLAHGTVPTANDAARKALGISGAPSIKEK